MESEPQITDVQRRMQERRSEQEQPNETAAAARSPATTDTNKRSRAKASTKEHFSEGLVPAQFKLPRDLVASLKLHSISSGKSMSDIVLECLTSEELVAKAWISTKRAA